jgi:hypothetical protein
MADPIDINRRCWDERATIHARDTTGFYTLDRFRAGESALHGIEAAELGDVRGKRVFHLQCHIGLDTLRLARLGAVATGLDFSAAAVEVARGLAEETGLKADFVQGTVDEAPRLTPGPFDLVFTTWGGFGRGSLRPCLHRAANSTALMRIPASMCWRRSPAGWCRLTTTKRLRTGR